MRNHRSMDHGSMEHGSMDHRSGTIDQGIMDQGTMDQGTMDQEPQLKGPWIRNHRSRDHGSRDHTNIKSTEILIETSLICHDSSGLHPPSRLEWLLAGYSSMTSTASEIHMTHAQQTQHHSDKQDYYYLFYIDFSLVRFQKVKASTSGFETAVFAFQCQLKTRDDYLFGPPR